MLQQTQVATVIPYYERFMRRFPSVAELAKATDEQLMGCWQGLGYYRRAENLRRSARALARGGGTVPRTVDALTDLPGIGDYTAGAIASIAYGERTAAVDGNVARVLSRLFGIAELISTPATMRRIWTLAESLLPVRRCGDFNQAWMDLGATVCTPRKPSCDTCPLAEHCVAGRFGEPESLPRKARKAAIRTVHHVAVVVVRDGTVLTLRRPPGGLWARLWEIPNVACKTSAPKRSAARELLAEHGVSDGCLRSTRTTIEHRLTHRLMTYAIYAVEQTNGERSSPDSAGRRWVPVQRLDRLPMSTVCRKMVAAAL